MQTAIVTGAGSGIGRATALRLSALGYAVALVGRTFQKLELVAGEIQKAKAGSQTLCIGADVSDAEQVQAMIVQVADTWGRVDVLVNNAGLAPLLPTADFTLDQWHAVINTNLSAVFYTTRAVWPIMSRQHALETQSGAAGRAKGRGGVIVNISSMASRDPFPGLGVYAAAKAGVNMLSLATAREGEKVGIRVVCIAPAGVDTPMLREVMGDKLSPEEVLRPEDVAVLIGEVVGPLSFTSGETLFVHRRPA